MSTYLLYECSFILKTFWGKHCYEKPAYPTAQKLEIKESVYIHVANAIDHN